LPIQPYCCHHQLISVELLLVCPKHCRSLKILNQLNGQKAVHIVPQRP
jgi:hypothetical protein